MFVDLNTEVFNFINSIPTLETEAKVFSQNFEFRVNLDRWVSEKST